MNIVFNSLSLGLGGAERVIINLCEYFRDTGNLVTIIAAIHNKTKYDIPSGVEVKYLDNTFDQMHENKVTRFFRRRKKLITLLIEIRPDIIISFLPEPNILVLSLRKYINAPIIVSIRNDPAMMYSNILYYTIMRALFPKADGYVFQTQGAKKYFRFSSRIENLGHIIPNPVNKEFLLKPFSGVRDNVIVSVGRLEPLKNHRILITAFSNLNPKYYKYRLIIYGGGSQRKPLENYIVKLGLEKRVELAGEKANINELIYKSSLFVLSSDNEGMPNSLIEAMCLGLPVVSTDCPSGGPAFLIKDGVNGLLCEVGNPVDLQAKIESILSDTEKSKRLSLEASKLTAKLNLNTIGGCWIDYMNKIFEQRNVG